MMSMLMATLPLQFACNLISPVNINKDPITVPEPMVLNSSSLLPDGYVTFFDIGLAYKYYENPLTWNMARKQCIAEGGRLAVLDSFKKIGYGSGLTGRRTSVHVGIHRMFNSGDWIDDKTGKSLGFIPWKADAVLTVLTQECACMWSDGSGLTPLPCSHVLPSICEIPIFKNDNRMELFRSTDGPADAVNQISFTEDSTVAPITDS